MTKAKRMLSLLLAVIMVLSVIPITASAAENDGTTGGIKTHKEYNEETGYLTLEAYVTGESQTQIVAQPVDIALVLDTSGSMEELEAATLYSWAYKYSDSFIEVGSKGSMDALDTVYGAEEGVYMIRSTSLSNSYAPMRYIDGEWQYCGLGLNLKRKWKPVEDSDWGSGKIYITKLNALKIAVKRFIDSAAAASDPTNPNRISIIKFAGTKTNAVGNDTYKEGGFTYNYSQIVQNLTDVNANKEALKDVIGTSAKAASDTNPRGLTPGGATQADFGMQHAQTVLANTDSSRKKVAIMFTDGEPTSGNSFETAVANGAITAAKALKDSGTTIFTVGCFSTTPKTDPTTYMNYVSSNYPNATSLTSGGASVSTKYYSTAATSADLTGIFKKISQEVGGASVTLTATTVLKDTVSKYFDLDTDGVDAKAIKVHTETCTAIDADGNPTAWSNDNNPNQYKADVVGKTITVTGFDYSANWVGSHNGRPGGKKIVLEIPIKPIDEKCWGLGLPTNDAENSGIYVGENPVAPFPVPTVDYPYYEIVHVRMGTDGKPFYTGDQTNQVIADPAAVNAANRVRITDNTATVDLTTRVPAGYLYGGSFSNPTCTTPWSYGKESAKSFRPQSGATYYIWEAPVDYLVPKSLSLSKTIEGQPNVIGFYLLTGVDRQYYQSAGFDVTDGNGDPIAITDVGEADPVGLTGNSSSKVYKSLTTVYTNGTSATYKPGEGVFSALRADTSYLACFSVPSDAWAAKDKKVVFTPYWITLDGMKVTGTTTRTCQSDGPGSRVVKKIAETESGSTIMPANTAVQMLLTACGNVAVDGSENAPSASVDPIDPVVPIDPIDPVTPVDPVEPAKQFSVTVYDGGSVYTLSAEAGEDISSRLVSAGMHGMRFAGWFLDERSTAAAELKNVQGDMDVYAKYVSDTYLTLRYRNVGLFRSRNVKLYAALDSTDYAEAGFVIDGKAVSCPITKDAYTAFFLYGSTVREDNTLVSYTYGTSDLRYGDTVEITPYWVTLDGTTVYGTTQTLTYGRFGLM